MSSTWEKNQSVLQSYGTGQDAKMHKYIEESQEYYGTQLFRELKKQNKIDVVIRHFNPTVNPNERERVNEDDSDEWDSEDMALLNCEDPDLRNAEQEYRSRMKKMMTDASKTMQEAGLVKKCSDKEFLEIANKEPYVVLCFFHGDFFRTTLLINHLKKIAEKQPCTQFIQVDAEHSFFLTKKLGVRMLPSMYVFIEGVLQDSMVGFDDFGGTDQFKTPIVWKRLAESGVIEDRNGNRRKKQKRTQVLC